MDPQLSELISQHRWFFLAAILIGLAVRLLKSDTIGPAIPAKWRALVAIVMGIGSGIAIPVLQKLGSGVPPKDALLWGVFAAFTAIAGHNVIVDAARGGKDLPMPSFLMKSEGDDEKQGKMPPPPAVMTLAALALLSAFLALPTTACSPALDAKVNADTQAVLDGAEYACTMASTLTSVPALAIACGIVKEAGQIVPAIEQWIESLIEQRTQLQAAGYKYVVNAASVAANDNGKYFSPIGRWVKQ